MSDEIIPFEFNGNEVRTLIIDGALWFVGNDVARVLGYSNPSDALQRVDPEDRQYRTIALSEGSREVMRERTLINESGAYDLVFGSNIPGARSFKRWVTSVVLPAIRRTGTYTAPAAVERLPMDIIREQHGAISYLLEDNEKLTVRAVVAEEFKTAIEVADGLTLREFNKHYLPDMGERKFFDVLYTRGLLIDQRAQRVGLDGKPKAGKQHRHPSFRGKAFFYLHPTLDHEGTRFENTRVRPGDPELALLAYFEKLGWGDLKAVGA